MKPLLGAASWSGEPSSPLGPVPPPPQLCDGGRRGQLSLRRGCNSEGDAGRPGFDNEKPRRTKTGNPDVLGGHPMGGGLLALTNILLHWNQSVALAVGGQPCTGGVQAEHVPTHAVSLRPAPPTRRRRAPGVQGARGALAGPLRPSLGHPGRRSLCPVLGSLVGVELCFRGSGWDPRADRV